MSRPSHTLRAASTTVRDGRVHTLAPGAHHPGGSMPGSPGADFELFSQRTQRSLWQ